ncbi:MAG: cell wall hydrolase [Lachnospiraceae bacterium]|nr:cell wall hydrolase [Lachnospiraceae bacterium]
MKRSGRPGQTRMLCVFLSVLIFLTSFTVVQASSTTRQQLEEEQQKKSNLEEEMEQNQSEIESKEEQKTQLNTTLSGYNAELSAIENDIYEMEQAIDSKEAEIEQKTAELEEAKATEETQYANMLLHIQYMYESDTTATYINAMLNAVMGGGSFSDFLNVSEYVEQLAAYDKQLFEDYQAIRETVEAEEAALEAEKAELDEMLAELESDKEYSQYLISQVQSAISTTNSEIASIENELTAQEEELATINNNIAELQEKLAQELALSRAAASGTWRDISEVEFSEYDVTLLANLIYCEARGESYEGMLAVGSVVINRVLSGSYPDTVSGVIYQSGQFAPVTSTKNSFVEALAADKAANSSGCYQAAREAMLGITNVGTCVYFQTIAYLEAVDRLDVVVYVIGNHGFY